ncbi:MAG TPA: hypothetical protein VFE58_17400 [Tepidisphaeraceae bacterium]|jgi:hypothetical protein|nr:hypothetical protein [Tepidisphaeraceae bacterium]
MAKGKHSTALFEVINKPVRGSGAPPTVVTRAPLAAAPPPQRPMTAATVSPGPEKQAVKLDPDRQQISLRISYTSAVVTCFAVVVVMVLAYLLGRGVDHSAPLAGVTTEQIKSGPTHPQAMEVDPSGINNATPASSKQIPANTAPVQATATNTPVTAPTNVKRIVGENYVIMQSYPDEASAKDAQAVLLNSGISCTVERGPEKWVPMSWYSVMGTQPFDHITRNAQLDAYVKAIDSVKYGEKSKFKKFEPRAYKWK